MNRKRVAVLVIVLLATAGFIFAQTPAQKLPSAMVYVPVGVTGPKGAVMGLKRENFVLLEDGIEQTINVFYEPNSRIDIDIILAMRALNKGRTDQNSVKIREAIENFRHQGNSQNKYTVEEMPFGANGIFDAMSRHVTRLAEQSIATRKAVVVVTDGFESSGGEPAKTLQEYVKKFDVPIYIFYAVDPTAPNQPGPTDDILEVARGERIYLSGGAGYEDLTRMTGGSMTQADIDTQLRSLMEEFGRNLKNQYVLGFRSTNDARDDKWRKLEIKVKGEPVDGVAAKDMKTKARDRYFVAKPPK